MNRRDLLKTTGAAAALAAVAGPGVTHAMAEAASRAVSEGPRQVRLLNAGWRFHEGDLPLPLLIGHDATYAAAKAGAARGAASPKYDDSAWQRVTLPHDFASFQPIENVPEANIDQGFRRRGVGWYRNTLRFAEADRGKHIELQIEGAATLATVWFNGTLVSRNWSGYSSVYIDITPYITYGDALNSLVVRVDATEMEGWWYEGAGLYRDVWIVRRDPVHIITDGVFAHPVKTDGGWTVPVEVTLENSGKAAAEATVISELRDGAKILSRGESRLTVEALERASAKYALTHATPRLWSPDDPQLYTVVTRVVQDGRVSDEVVTQCGFRTQRFDAKTGFYLNDAPVKIKGVCLHQDHAGVGTAVPEGLIDFRLRRMKSLGCNAIRMTHSAQDRRLMDACDRHGFLVMAENRNFNPSSDYMAQLEWLVRRDRNHPSVIMWSVFNEEPMQGTEAGYEMVRRMSHAVKILDPTRAVTAAMNDGLFTPLNVAHAVDVVGINYQQKQYDPFHAAYPDKPMMSSEDTSAFMTRGAYVNDAEKRTASGYDDYAAEWGGTHRSTWKTIATRPFVAGGFVWTGFDYHGEPTPFATYPSNSSVFGILDLCGFEKPAANMHRAAWIEDKPFVGLVPHHWNWQAGETVRVMGCANTEEVELFVNGKSLGRQTTDRLEMNEWRVPFSPGRVEARGLNGGKVVATAYIETAGDPVALRLVPDRKDMAGDGRDAQPVTVEAVDRKGRVHPFASQMVNFAVEGGAITGLGNGDSNSTESEKGDRRSLFHGLVQVIVQTTPGQKAPLRLRASAVGLKAAELTIAVTPSPGPMAQMSARIC